VEDHGNDVSVEYDGGDGVKGHGNDVCMEYDDSDM
jgi:hypothetical protein